MLRRPAYLALFLGALFGYLATQVVGLALATRNSSGTYSLPAGNPVVSGTTITASNENAFRSDVATAITDSLDRNGKGAMLAALELANGTVAAPALTFDSDTDCGLYRIGTNNPAMASNGTKIQDWSSTGTTVTGTLAVTSTLAVTGATTQTGVLATATGITATQSTSNSHAITATGNGTGAGGSFVAGATAGADAITSLGGAGGSRGIQATGTGIYEGVRGNGGATGNGVNGYAGGTPTANTNTRFGLVAAAGHLSMGGGNPTSTTAFSNAVTPTSAVKAWATLTPSGAGTVTVEAGFNVTSVTCGNTGNDDYIVTMASAMTGTKTYVVIPTKAYAGVLSSFNAVNVSSTVFHIRGAGACDTDTGDNLMGFVVLGLQ